MAEQPDTLSVVRDRQGVAAYAYHVLHPTGSALEDRDPVTRAALAHVARHDPASPPGRAGRRRPVFAGRREHQRDQYAVLAGTVSSLIEWVSRPLAWSIVVIVDDEYWGPYFDYLAFARLFEVDVGGLTRVAYGNDWRRFPMDTWLDPMNEREHAAGGLRINCIGMFPASRRGPLRDGDERFETVTARRPALEAAVAAVAGRTPGVRIRRGVAVTGLLTDPNERAPVPRVGGC